MEATFLKKQRGKAVKKDHLGKANFYLTKSCKMKKDHK